jgi:hypothetical protein
MAGNEFLSLMAKLGDSITLPSSVLAALLGNLICQHSTTCGAHYVPVASPIQRHIGGGVTLTLICERCGYGLRLSNQHLFPSMFYSDPSLDGWQLPRSVTIPALLQVTFHFY